MCVSRYRSFRERLVEPEVTYLDVVGELNAAVLTLVRQVDAVQVLGGTKYMMYIYTVYIYI